MNQTIAEKAQKALAFVRQKTTEVPDVAVVLGSGVAVLEGLTDSVNYPFLDVFGVAPSVQGHSGSLTIGRLGDSSTSKLVAVFRGRFHLYEGHDWSTVTLPAQLIAEWGIPQLLLTNAAGGLNKTFHVGDLMVLTGYRDHLSPELQKTGLIPALEKGVQDCNNKLVEKILSTGQKLAGEDKDFRSLQKGTYCALTGPNYETMAEIEMLRRLKGDAVGMSTVPELLTVKGTGTEAAAVSVVTNVWREDEPMGGHEEVLEASKQASLRLDRLFRALLSS